MGAGQPVSWTAEAESILARACARHGGVQQWRALESVRLVPHELNGLIPWLKGHRRSFALPSAMTTAPHACRTRFEDYPEAGTAGVFENGDVWLESQRDSTPIRVSRQHRRSLAGLAKYRRWSPLDALYFFGYAIWHYHSLPFTLADARLLGVASQASRHGKLDILDLELPAVVPTHGRRQRFYFDESGLLLRHDYHAEIIGFWARGAHFWRDYRAVGGVQIAFDRHVTPRVGSLACPGTALHASFSSAEAVGTRLSGAP